MIQEEYVSFEQAKALKELGFPQEHQHLINHSFINGLEDVVVNDPIDVFGEDRIKRPTLSLVQKWLREEKDIYFLAIPCIRDVMGDLSKCDYYDWRIVYNGSEPYTGLSDTYEQALSAGIDKCIELLKRKSIMDNG